MSLVRLAAFGLFLVLGAVMTVASRTRFAKATERAFIALTVALMLVAGLGNRDLWPFSSYPIIPESSLRYREGVWYEVRVVDAAGHEHRVDRQAWSPLAPTVIDKWIERTFMARLDDGQRRRAALFLLSQAESNQCSTDRLLGLLAAPDWLLGPRGERVHAVALRIYRNDVSLRSLAYEVRR